jgi:transcriptional regulator with XRE-family HTH domain
MSRWVNPETQMPGVSQRRLGAETGISQTQLHEILKKGHSPGADILKKLAGFFDVNPLALFRLAYFEEDEAGDVAPEISARLLELFLELERLLAQLPRDEQLEYFDGFVKETKALALLVEKEE